MPRCTEWWDCDNGLYGANIKKGVDEQTALTKLAAYEDYVDEPKGVKKLLAELETYRAKGTPDELEKVVRCKDCKRMRTENAPKGKVYVCNYMRKNIEKSGFCMFGERRES